MSLSDFMDDADMAELLVSAPAEELLHGAVWTEELGRGWIRPWRFTKGQLKAIGSCRAWHPGLYRTMAACTAGVCLEFETDSSAIVVEARLDPFPKGTLAVFADLEGCHFSPKEPYDGVSCEVDGRVLPCVYPERDARGEADERIEFALDDPAEAPERGVQRLPRMGRAHHVRVWLPCLTGCALKNVIGDGNTIEPVAPRRQLLAIGDSITQGFVAGNPALTWPALLAKRLDLDLLNQGIGGQVFLPGFTVGLSEVSDPAQIIVQLGENYRYEPCQLSRISRDIKTSLYEVEEAFPDVPTWVLTPLWHLEQDHPSHPGSCFSEVPDLIRTTAKGHDYMRVVEGRRLLQASPVMMADGYEHPNADGCATIAERLNRVMDTLSESAETRRQRAITSLKDGPIEAFPLLECARRGIGEMLVAEKDVFVLDLNGVSSFVWGSDRAALRRAVDLFASNDLVCLLGDEFVRDVRRDMHFNQDAPCHLVVYDRKETLPVDPSLDIRTLTPAYVEPILKHYSHPEYLADGELEELLASGAILGGFERGRLCAFVGEHREGAIGMLEVFPESRRQGWGTALEAAKINQQLSQGYVPWSEIWPDNKASLALQKKLGLTIYPPERMHFLSRVTLSDKLEKELGDALGEEAPE